MARVYKKVLRQGAVAFGPRVKEGGISRYGRALFGTGKNLTDSHDSIECSVSSMTASWLERAKRGDDEAWNRLDRVYRRLVCWWCLKAEIPARDVDDVVQDVFVAVAKGLAGFEPKSFRGWLWTLTKRRIQDYWRRRSELPMGRAGSVFDEPLSYVEAETSRSVDAATKIVFDGIVSLVRSEFSDGDWHAFWSVVVDGNPPATVAEELGVTRNKVYLAKSRILRRIREVFGDQMHTE